MLNVLKKATCGRFTLSRWSIYLALKILFLLPTVSTKLISLVKISAYWKWSFFRKQNSITECEEKLEKFEKEKIAIFAKLEPKN